MQTYILPSAQPLSTLTIAVIVLSLSQAVCVRAPAKRISVETRWRPAGVRGPYKRLLHFQTGSPAHRLKVYPDVSENEIQGWGLAHAGVLLRVWHTPRKKPLIARLAGAGDPNANTQPPDDILLTDTRKFEARKPLEAETSPRQRPSCYLEPLAGLLISSKHLMVPNLNHQVHLSVEPKLLLIFLLLPAANIGLLTLAFFYGENHPQGAPKQPPTGAVPRGTWGLVLALASQILYFVLAALWQIRWLRFPPGNFIIISAVLVGLLLSASAFVAAFFTSGLKRWASVFVALTTAGLWLLAAVGVAAG